MAQPHGTLKTTAPPERRGGHERLHRWGSLVAISLATLMMLMDFMGVSVALPEVRRALNGSFSEMQWVLEAFVLTLAAFVLTAGYVADLAGRRTIFLLGLAVLALGSLLGGLAPNAYVLIGGRVLQGMGGALLFATGSILMGETFGSGRWRAALAVWGTVTGLAVAFSPLVGGAITDYLGWRWIFLIDVPTSAVALLVGALSIRDKVPVGPEDASVLGPVHGPDWKGLALFSAAIAILVIGLVRATTTLSGWAANGVLACFGCTALLLIAFIAVEAVSPAPMLDISLFRQRTFTGSSIAAFGLSAAVLGPFLFLVLYLSYDLGYSVMSVAVRLLLLTAMTLPFLPLTGVLDRLFPIKALICGGLVLVAVGFWLMSRLTATSTASQLIPGLVIAGVGLELVNPRLASAAVAAVKPRLAAVASRTSSTFRQIGTATGVAVFGAVLATRLTDDLNSALSSSTQLVGQGPQLTSLVLNGQIAQAATTPGAPAGLLGIIHHAFADSMHEVFLVAAIVALASAVLALSVRSRDVPRAPVRGARATSRRPAPLAVPAPKPAVPEPVMSEPVLPEVPEPALFEPALFEPALAQSEPGLSEPGLSEPAPLEPVASEPVPSEPEMSEPVPSQSVPEVPLELVAVGSGPLDNGAVDGGPSDAVTAEGLTEAGPVEDGGPESEPAPAEMPTPVGADVTGASFIGVYTEYGAPAEERTPLPRHVRGQVTRADGDPLAGASVALVHPNGDEVGHTYAAEDGSFYLDDVAAGTYTLVVAALHYRPAARVIVLSHGETLAMVSLLGVGSLVVRVSRARDAMPLAAGIELFNGNGSLVAQSQAGDDGVSILPDLLEGNYELAVEREHYSPARGPVVVRRGRTGTAEVQLVGQGHLYGAVLDPEGGWLPATLVTLADESGALVGVTRTDGAGAFLFPTVPEGTYTLSAGHRDAVLTVEIGAGTAAQADLVLAPPIPLETPPAPVMTVPENGPEALSARREG